MSNPLARNICDSKVMYDTEFEAQLGAARAEGDFKSPMRPYKCGTHWHIANKDRSLRTKSRTKGIVGSTSYCAVCLCYLKSGRWASHIQRAGHLARLEANIGGKE